MAQTTEAPLEGLEPLLEALPDGIVVVGRGGRIVYANQLMQRLSGYSRRELLGKPIELLVPEAARFDHERHREGYAGSPRARPMGMSLDIALQRKDGTVFPADIALSPLTTEPELLVVAAVRDATERRQAQRLLAVLEDRERIAKELHDGVIQALFAVGMTLQATEAKSGDREVVRNRLAEAVDSIDEIIRDLRNYIFGLRPGLLADRRLDEALRELTAEFQERTGIVAAVDIDPRVAARFANSSGPLVQIVREALSNVARHSQAGTCRLSFLERDGQAMLEIDDDGRGLDGRRAGSAGQGLRNMQERAAAIGGRFSLESAPGQGSTVRVTLPL